MNNLMIVGLTLLSTLIVIGATVGLMPILAKKGIKVDKIVEKADMVLDGVDAVVGIADKLLPNNPAIGTLKVIEKYAHIGVNEAEQLYLNSQLDKEQRNTKSKETIYAALKIAGIDRTPDIEKIVDGAIEAEVLALGHKTQTDAEREVAHQELQSKLNNQVQENNNLKQIINQIQGTVSTVPAQQ